MSSGLLGLSTCLATGPANAAFPTCGSQNVLGNNIFGFYSVDFALSATYPEPRMGASQGFVTYSQEHTNVNFYSINAGSSDEIVCPTSASASCSGPYFSSSSNFPASVNVGQGHPSLDTSQTDCDTTGVGHCATLELQINMAQRCSGVQECCDGYDAARRSN